MAHSVSAGRSLEAEPIPDPDDAGRGPFFRRVDKGAFWAAFLITFGFYFHTMAPTVTLEDSGELAVGSDYLGVPHPPGYPIWVLFTWLFQWLFHWVKYFGTPDSNELLVWKSILLAFGKYSGPHHPNPAWSVGMCSAFSGALAAGLQAMLVSRAGLDMLRGIRRATEVLGEKQESFICLMGGIASGLLLAFSPVLWSQSTIVEVYSLNAAFQVGCLVLLYRWMRRPNEDLTLIMMWYVFGLGITNHQTLLFLGPALAVGILVRDFRLFSTFAVAGMGVIGWYILNKMGSSLKIGGLVWSQGPGTLDPFSIRPMFWVETALVLFTPFLCWKLGMHRGRAVWLAVWAMFAGVAFNFFMPYASEQNPPINWGYPRTWEGFMHAITRGQYEAVNTADMFGARYLDQIGMYLRDLRGNFTLPAIVLGLLPFCAWSLKLGARRFRAIYPAAFLTLLVMILALVEWAVARDAGDRNGIALTYRYLGMLVVPMAGFGLMIKVVNFFKDLWNEKDEEGAWQAFIAWAILIITGLGLVYADIQWMIHLARENMDMGHKVVILFFIFAPPAAVFLIHTLSTNGADLACDLEKPMQRVLLMSLVAFLSLSVLFITFQNLEMDIQTLFIGRVQFIQSHAVYSLFLGFGLIFLLTHLDIAMRGIKPITYLGAVVAAVALPGTLVWQNYNDPEQIRLDGGAQQNKHDFGWHFGAWQLAGAQAVLESVDEEQRKKYPDPTYPPAMEKNAIFFGGTDPGRFVPTYMIYGGHFRPDVYLITQNALADNTYMNVMRDLYGDLIYIPSQQDSNGAFQQYVSDVQSGKIQAGADVSFEGGRVQVQGVGGVMTINGILCDQIFKKNKARHAFYVEESYVIPWMYPYLSPHGLIMKLNAEPTPDSLYTSDSDTVKKDRAFWNWYLEYLIGTGTNLPQTVTKANIHQTLGLDEDTPVELLERNVLPPGIGPETAATNAAIPRHNRWTIGGRKEFHTDVVARKTMSKLRSAIAGLYIARRNFAEGEYAFRQAIDLYPLSPEANFRLADSYMQQTRFAQARQTIEDFLTLDPMNTKVASFLNQIKDLERINNRRVELEQKLNTGADINSAFELMAIYRNMNMHQRMDGLAEQILNEKNLPPQLMLQIAQIYAEGKRFDRMGAILQRYLQKNPTDAAARVNLAKCFLAMQNLPACLGELRTAVQQGGEPVRNMIRGDQSFSQISGHPEFQKIVPPQQNASPFGNAPAGLPF